MSGHDILRQVPCFVNSALLCGSFQAQLSVHLRKGLNFNLKPLSRFDCSSLPEQQTSEAHLRLPQLAVEVDGGAWHKLRQGEVQVEHQDHHLPWVWLAHLAGRDVKREAQFRQDLDDLQWVRVRVRGWGLGLG